MVGSSLGKLFGRSPFGPMQRHMEKAQECVDQLIPFFDRVLAGDWQGAGEVQRRIQALEEEADRTKKDIRHHLPGALLMPVPRTDLLELLRMQDKIPNRARDIAGIMLGRRMEIPPELSERMTDFVRAAIATSAQALDVIEELDELLETGFSGREADLTQDMIGKLDALERHTDELEVSIRAALFRIESELPPVNVMFLYKVIDWIGELADLAQRVGSRLELMMAR